MTDTTNAKRNGFARDAARYMPVTGMAPMTTIRVRDARWDGAGKATSTDPRILPSMRDSDPFHHIHYSPSPPVSKR